MRSICIRCGKEYKTGADRILNVENGWSKLIIALEHGFNSSLEEKSESESNFCPECANKIFKVLCATLNEWRYPTEMMKT